MVYAELAEKLDTAGCRTFWFGAADKEQVLAVVPQNLVRRET